MSGTDDNELMKLRPLQFVSPAFEGSPVGIAALDERFHFLMAADDNYGWDASGREVTLRARSGLRVRIPDDLAGSSGCSVWKLGELTQPPGSFASSKLVGVLTGVYPKAGVIKATRWEAILELMCQAFLK
jgi:hypothetical protein